MLACVHCGAALGNVDGSSQIACGSCGAVFRTNRAGYFVMLGERAVPVADYPDDYAAAQHEWAPEMVANYLHVLAQQEPCRTVLDVGCGVGAAVTALNRAGMDAYGIDLPQTAPLWARAGNDPRRFFVADATKLPFADDVFDFVVSLGVIEHIGTLTGDATLAPDFAERRREYARELIRVTRPGGRIVIACPNKAFPIDLHHGPGDHASQPGALRGFLYARTGMNWHKPWGAYHLLSYGEARQLFCGDGGCREFRALPLRGYFQFGRFQRGFLKPFGGMAKVWIERMPRFVRSSFLNPMLMAQIRK